MSKVGATVEVQRLNYYRVENPNTDYEFRLSRNFKLYEFLCPCGTCQEQVLVSERLITALQDLRDRIGVPIQVNSGYRCKKHNIDIGGSSKSLHMFGMAADIETRFSIGLNRVKEMAMKIPEIGGIGDIKDENGDLVALHLDVRSWSKRRATWTSNWTSN